MWHFAVLIACAAVIYVSCEWFVNAVEWLGQRMRVSGVAVATVLAALGTALPESAVTFAAVTHGDPSSRQIGVGAAMGGPLALATVAYGATGVALLITRRRSRRPQLVTAGGGGDPEPAPPALPRGPLGVRHEYDRLLRDQKWFLAVFAAKIAIGLVAFSFKPWLGLLFFAAYAVYFGHELRGGSAEEREELEPLRLQRDRIHPATWAVVVQTLGALALTFFASQLFVSQLEAVGPLLGLSGAATALLLSPLATELPEMMNAVAWVRQGKNRLALANISGSMMVQATVPSGLGVLFTDWRLQGPLLWSGAVTALAIAYLLATLLSRAMTPVKLAWAGALYGVFALGLIPILA